MKRIDVTAEHGNERGVLPAAGPAAAGPAAAGPAAPAAAPAARAPVRLPHADLQALQPLEDEINMLGASRQDLANLRQLYSKKKNGTLADRFLRRGSSKHHRHQAEAVLKITAPQLRNIPFYKISKAHTDIANSIESVRAAHEDLMRTHPHLAEKVGKTGAKTRLYKTPSGLTMQSLGNYHGKDITDTDHTKTFGKGGRKTRKHKRKHKRKTKRKTSKHKTKTKKTNRKTKRKTNRKTKRKTKKHRR